MFGTIRQRELQMIDYIGYVKEARENGLGDAEYFAKMEKILRNCLKGLEKNSSNKKLVARYAKLINELF